MQLKVLELMKSVYDGCSIDLVHCFSIGYESKFRMSVLSDAVIEVWFEGGKINIEDSYMPVVAGIVKVLHIFAEIL